MAMSVGNAQPGSPRTGLAGALMNVIEDAMPKGFPNRQTELSIADVMEGIAGAIIDHITDEAEVTVASGIACSVDPVSHSGETDETGSGTIA